MESMADKLRWGRGTPNSPSPIYLLDIGDRKNRITKLGRKI
jgi:hypothetical protein